MRHFRNILQLAAVAAFLFVFSGTAEAGRVIVVKTRPPVVKVEVRPKAPFRNAVWLPGRWHHQRGAYVWVGGSWQKQRHGYSWIPGRWVKRPNGWVHVSGHWKRVR